MPPTCPMERFTSSTSILSRLRPYRWRGLPTIWRTLPNYLGIFEYVHFGKLKAGSLSVAARVDEIAQRKVEKRVEELRYGVGPQPARKALREIDDKLADDNAVGHIVRGNAKLIEFPGGTRPVEQTGTLDGEVIQVGGRDGTINIHLKAGERQHRPGARFRHVGTPGVRRLAAEEIRDLGL